MSSPTFLNASLFVAFGGGLGAWLRFVTGRLWSAAIGASAASTFPWATLTVNVAGSFAMGLLAAWLARSDGDGEGWRLLLGVGVLGGFTTFSAFSLEFVAMAQRGAMVQAAGYVVLSLVLGFAALFMGLSMMRVTA